MSYSDKFVQICFTLAPLVQLFPIIVSYSDTNIFVQLFIFSFESIFIPPSHRQFLAAWQGGLFFMLYQINTVN